MDINGTLISELPIIQALNLSEEISNTEISPINNSYNKISYSINETFVSNSTLDINPISDEISKSSILESTRINLKEINKSQIIENSSFSNNITYRTHINEININKNETYINNLDSTVLNIVTNSIKENNQIIANISANNKSDVKNVTSHITNQNNTKNIHNKFIDNIDPKLILGLEIFFPIIVLIIAIIFILYCIKRKKKILIQENINNEKNGIKFQNIVNTIPYNRVQNTSGFNVGINPNNYSMSEIKVQNLKDEIHNIINNNSGGSNSSGKRKREKRKMGNNNMNYSSQENNKGIQNEIQEEIKKYVIDEHINNN